MYNEYTYIKTLTRMYIMYTKHFYWFLQNRKRKRTRRPAANAHEKSSKNRKKRESRKNKQKRETKLNNYKKVTGLFLVAGPNHIAALSVALPFAFCIPHWSLNIIYILKQVCVLALVEQPYACLRWPQVVDQEALHLIELHLSPLGVHDSILLSTSIAID